MPRFIWTATALAGNKPVLSLLFDATDVAQGKFFIRAIEYDLDVGSAIHAYSEAVGPENDSFASHPQVWKIFKWFATNRGQGEQTVVATP